MFTNENRVSLARQRASLAPWVVWKRLAWHAFHGGGSTCEAMTTGTASTAPPTAEALLLAVVLRDGYLELGALVDGRWRRHGAAGALHKVQALVRIATEQPLAAGNVCVAGHRGPHAWVGRLREARGEQQRGRSRLTVALVGAAGHGKAGAAGSRASIRLFLLRPRVARSIDP